MRVLWIWLTACLTLVRAADHSTIYDVEVADLSTSLINDTVRKKILKTCDDPLVWAFDQDPIAVWEGLGCYELHGILDYNWYVNQSATDLSYVEYISKKMHGPMNWKCHKIKNTACDAGDVACTDTEFACGHLILNSFANIHNMYTTGYLGLMTAHAAAEGKVYEFTDIFAPKPPDLSWFGDLIIPLITLGLGAIGAGSGRILSRVLNHIKNLRINARKGKNREKTPEELAALDKKYNTTRDRVKDTIVQAAGMAMPYGLIHVPEKYDGRMTEKQISDVLTFLFERYMFMQEKQIENLFNGSSSSMRYLSRMVDGGTFFTFDGNQTLFDYHQEVKRMFFAALIPYAWRLGPGYADDTQGPGYEIYSDPLFLKSGVKCGEKPPKFYLDNLHEICYEGDQWYITVIRAEMVTSDFWGNRHWSFSFLSPPGVDRLLNTEPDEDDNIGYRNVTATDLLISALSAYKLSGEQYWGPSEDTPAIKKDGSGYALTFTDGVRSPGLVQMQVCTDFKKLEELLGRSESVDEMDDPEWPCGLIED